MNKKLLIIITGIFLISVLWWYLSLGGLSDIDYQIIDSGPIEVYGEHYKGRYNSSEVENLFFKARDLARSSKNIKIAIINYGDDEEAKTIDQFIGVTGMDKAEAEKAGYTSRVVEGDRFLKALIVYHNAVMPQPGEVREGAEEYATPMNIELGDYSLELYTDERTLEVLFPVH